MENPLLSEYEIPPFNHISFEHIQPAIKQIIKENLQSIDALTASHPNNWAALIKPLEVLDDKLHRAWSPIRHLNSVKSSDELREIYHKCLPLITDYSSQVGQNAALYQAFVDIKNTADFESLEPARQKVIDNAIRDFQLEGVALEEKQKQAFKSLRKVLSDLENKFQDNVLDATDNWFMDMTDSSKLKGVPQADLALFEQKAKASNIEGYRLTLDFPCYHAIVTFAEDRTLRETLYEAFVTRASDQGPLKNKYDNSTLMVEILKNRHALAKCLGFKSYAHYSLERKMAESVESVLQFLNELALKAKAFAEKDIALLKRYAKEKDGLTDLKPWDINYYAEKYKTEQFALSQEALRPYFPIGKVLQGMFDIVKETFGIQVKAVDNVATWDDTVAFFEVYDKTNTIRGKFYLDLYARPKKRQGAWMDDAIGRRKRADESIQTPVAYVTCNFRPATAEQPALLTHDEVVTLFHEFGHALHHMLTQIDHLDVSGINGVPWDAVELPSQFLENWCWQAESLPMISSHYQTQEPLLETLFSKLLQTKNFLSGLFIVRQIEFALFDFRIHLEFDEKNPDQIQTTLDDVRSKVAVVPQVPYNRFQHSFTHIFSGGYAAGYYSYLWAEVLSSDAFARFKEEGLFNPKVGAAFLQNILEKGGSEEPDRLFRLFRGRAYKIDYLLESYGLLETG